MTIKHLTTAALTAVAALLASLAAEGQASAEVLRYGRTYYVQNGQSNWQGGYLDTKNSGCESNMLCVSTASTPKRDGGSGAWRLVSALGKPEGTPVSAGDKVYLQNIWTGNGGYLDTRGSGCEGNRLCVSTAFTPTRDGGSGAWTVLAADGSSGQISEDQDIRLKNNWLSNAGYLDTRGTGCEGNLDCVSTNTTRDTSNSSTSWRVTSTGHNPYAAWPVASRSDTFCYDTTGFIDQILDNGIGKLWWDATGKLYFFDNDSIVAGFPSAREVWGLSGITSNFNHQNFGKVCFESDGNLRVRDTSNSVVWQSGTEVTSNNRIELDQCTLRTVGDGHVKWSLTLDTCLKTVHGLAVSQSWCVDRSNTGNLKVLWDDQGELDWQDDGNLVFYKRDESGALSSLWASNTAQGAGQKMCVDSDGSLTVRNASGQKIFSTNPTPSAVVRHLTLDHLGVSLKTSESAPVEYWHRGTPDHRETRLDSGWCRTLDAAGKILDSGLAHLEWQGDGNLVLYRSFGGAVWATNTNGRGATLCHQTDDNLVIYNSSHQPIWASNTVRAAGYDETHLALKGCALSIDGPDGHSYWSQTLSPCPKTLDGGGFSFVYDKQSGNSNFGAEMWAIGASTNAASLAQLRSSVPSGSSASAALNSMLPATPPSGYAEVLGSGGISATIFSHNLKMLEADGYIGDISGPSTKLYFTIMGAELKNGPLSATYEKSIEKSFFEYEQVFMAGPVPITVKADVTGTLALSATIDTTPQMVLTPSGDLSANASAALGVDGFDVGVRGSLTLIHLETPLTLAYKAPTRTFSARGDLSMSSLDGKIDIFADALFVGYSKTIAQWDGVGDSWTLFNVSGSLLTALSPAPPLAPPRLPGEGPSLCLLRNQQPVPRWTAAALSNWT